MVGAEPPILPSWSPMLRFASRRVAIIVLLLLPAALVAQVGKVKGVRCTQHPSWTPDCSTDSECDALWTAHRCSAHSECSGSGGSGVSQPTEVLSLRGSPAIVTVRSAIIGGMIGGGAGSFKATPDSGSYAMSGAAIGAGSMLAMGVIANRAKWSRGGSVVAGAIAGGAIGAGVGLAADNKFKTGSAEDLATESKVGPDATAGAVGGAVMGFVFPSLKMVLMPLLRGHVPDPGRLALINRGSRVGLRILW